MSGSFCRKMQLIASLVFTLLVSPIACQVNTTNCNRCMDNGVACASETQYFKCGDGVILNDVLHDCAENKVCTNTSKICSTRSTLEPVCALTNTTLCGLCAKINPNNEVTSDHKTSFACVGPNHYKACRDHVISNNVTFNCEPGTVCSIKAYEETGKICVSKGVPNCLASCLETPNLMPKELEKACSKFEMRANIVCYNIQNPYDSECRSYLHCNRKDGQLQGRIIKCEAGFYNVHQNKCVQERPAMCGPKAEANATATVSTTPHSSTATPKKHFHKFGENMSAVPQAIPTRSTLNPEIQNGTLKEGLNNNATFKLEKKIPFIHRFQAQILGE